MTALQESNYEIIDIENMDLIPGLYNTVVIRYEDGQQVLQIPAAMEGLKFKTWRKTSSGILARDLLRRRRDQDVSKWRKVKSDNYISIIRLISELELDEFKALHLVHGKVSGSSYMHLKTVDKSKNICWSEGYINQTKKIISDEELEEIEDSREK